MKKSYEQEEDEMMEEKEDQDASRYYLHDRLTDAMNSFVQAFRKATAVEHYDKNLQDKLRAALKNLTAAHVEFEFSAQAGDFHDANHALCLGLHIQNGELTPEQVGKALFALAVTCVRVTFGQAGNKGSPEHVNGIGSWE